MAFAEHLTEGHRETPPAGHVLRTNDARSEEVFPSEP